MLSRLHNTLEKLRPWQVTAAGLLLVLVLGYFDHYTGPELLSVVARVLEDNVRKTDIPARLGGDEFAVVLAEAGYASAAVALEKLQSLLTEAMAARSWPVSFSIGAVSFHMPPPDVRDVIKLADDLMYGVKKSGKSGLSRIQWPTDGEVITGRTEERSHAND